MTNRKKEIAKFFCGFEAFHACIHGYLWFSGVTLTLFGIMTTPTLNIAGVIVNSFLSVILGIYAWRKKN